MLYVTGLLLTLAIYGLVIWALVLSGVTVTLPLAMLIGIIVGAYVGRSVY